MSLLKILLTLSAAAIAQYLYLTQKQFRTIQRPFLKDLGKKQTLKTKHCKEKEGEVNMVDLLKSFIPMLSLLFKHI